MWFGTREDEGPGVDDSLIPEWLPSHPWYGTAIVLGSVTRGKITSEFGDESKLQGVSSLDTLGNVK